MSEDAKTITPLQVRAPVGAEVFEIDWADGVVGKIPNTLLRGYCPCASCQGHSGEIRFIEGRNTVLDAIEEMGAYALQLTWGDGHASGIYTFRYLRALSVYAAEYAAKSGGSHAVLPRAVT